MIQFRCMKNQNTDNKWLRSVLRQSKRVVTTQENLQKITRLSRKDDIAITTHTAIRDNAIDGLQILLQGKIF